MSDNYHPLGLQRGIVRVVDADPRWPQLFRAEADRLAAAVNKAGLAPLALEHVGSTAVQGLVAKPILDFMAGCSPSADSQPYIRVCVALGYEPRGSQGVVGRELLVRGSEAARTHHLSLVAVGGAFWHEHVAFRERPRADPDVAAAYAKLKCDLAARHVGDREVTDENDVGALSAPGSIERLGGGGQPVHSTAF